MNGYIVPDIYAKHLPNTTEYSPGSVAVNFDTDYSTEEFVASVGGGADMRETSPGGSEITNILRSLLEYIDDKNHKKASIIKSNTATFENVTISTSPVNYLSTTTNDFMFFVNGVMIDNEIIVSFAQFDANVVLTIDTTLAD